MQIKEYFLKYFIRTNIKRIINKAVCFREPLYMRKDIDLQHFKNRLEDRLADIERQQDSRKSHSGPVELDQGRVGRLSRMDAMQQQAMSQAAGRLMEAEQTRILTALDRIRSGDYGYCIICDDEIAEGRLRSDPSVLSCISCAQKAEAK